MDDCRSQRWRDRRTSFRLPTETIDASIHSVDVISCQRQAKPFVEQHHYSASFPATRLSCGLFRSGPRGSRLVGVASFSVSMSRHAGLKYTGLEGNQSVELGRLVLLDEVEANGESWFLSRAFSLLRREKPDIEAVYAYSDPVPRMDAQGALVMPGHVGEIYQAMSARCRGRASGRTHYHTASGIHLSERTLSKIRLEERGHEYARRQLREAGLAAPRFGQDGRSWIEDLLERGEIGRRKHPGNWVYSFPLTRRAKARDHLLPNHPRPVRGPGMLDVTSPQHNFHFAS